MGHKERSSTCEPERGEHAKALVRLIQTTAHRWSRHEVFSDFVELSCLAVSNSVDRRQFEAREARYLEIAGKYPRDEFERFSRMLAHLTLAMERHCAIGEMGDALGSAYMQLELGNERAGQFFTPYEVSRLIAAVLVGDGAEARANGFLDIMEPACGAGGMVIAIAEALRRAGLDHHDTLHACCIDIDARCAYMTYLQLSLLHVPAIVLHANSLSGEVWSRWYTPAHVLGGWRQRLAARRERQRVAVPTDPAPTAADSASSTHGPSAASPRLAEQLKLFED